MIQSSNKPAAKAATHFSITVNGTSWHCRGDLVFGTAKNALEQSRALAWPESDEIVCEGIQTVDSTAVAFFLAIKRRAVTEKRSLILKDVPTALRDLAALYGVNDVLFAP